SNGDAVMNQHPSPPEAARSVLRFLAGIVSVPLVGCQPPESLVAETDRIAYEAISDVRRGLADGAGEFTIEDPGDSLRDRLMEEQNLSFRSPVSLSPGEVPFAEDPPGKPVDGAAPEGPA